MWDFIEDIEFKFDKISAKIYDKEIKVSHPYLKINQFDGWEVWFRFVLKNAEEVLKQEWLEKPVPVKLVLTKGNKMLDIIFVAEISVGLVGECQVVNDDGERIVDIESVKGGKIVLGKPGKTVFLN